MKKIISLLSFAVLLAFSSSAFADEPSRSEIAESLTHNLPAGWEIKRVKILASANEGDDVRPFVRQRFVATFTALENLYINNTELPPLGAHIPVSVVSEAGRETQIYGIASSVQRGRDWKITFEMEGELSSYGSVASSFGGAIFIPGTPDANQKMSEFKSSIELAEELALMSREFDEKKAEHAANLDAALSAIASEAQKRTEAAQQRLANAIDKIEASAEIQAQLVSVQKDTEALAQLKLAEEAKTAALLEAEDAKAKQLQAQLDERTKSYKKLLDGLASEDAATRKAAFDLALKADDTEVRLTAIELGLTHNDKTVRALALSARLSSLKSFTAQFSGGEDDEIHLLEFPISDLSATSPNSGLKLNNEDIVRVELAGLSVSGLRIEEGNQRENCAFSVLLNQDGTLTGNGDCDGTTYNSYPFGIGRGSYVVTIQGF